MVLLHLVRKCCPSGPARLERHFGRLCCLVFFVCFDLLCEYCPRFPERLVWHFDMVWLDLVCEYYPSGPERGSKGISLWCGLILCANTAQVVRRGSRGISPGFLFRFLFLSGVRILPKRSRAARKAFRYGVACLGARMLPKWSWAAREAFR